MKYTHTELQTLLYSILPTLITISPALPELLKMAILEIWYVPEKYTLSKNDLDIIRQAYHDIRTDGEFHFTKE